MRIALAVLLAMAGMAAADEPVWPPTPQTQERIAALQAVLGDAAATPAQRQAARAEIARLLMRPGAPPPGNRRPARAAVDPAPRIAAPTAAASPQVPAISNVAPPALPAQAIPDGRGTTLVPAGQNAIDPRTGRHLIDVGNGYLDPATGRFVPKP